jgi:hypothetical protein
MKSISTNELITKLKVNKRKIFEVAIVKDALQATHFIYFGGKLLYDTGIDSQEIKWKPQDFLGYYNSTFWQIDQVI